VSTTTPAPLPTTGFPVGFAMLVGVTLILVGLIGMMVVRNDRGRPILVSPPAQSAPTK